VVGLKRQRFASAEMLSRSNAKRNGGAAHPNILIHLQPGPSIVRVSQTRRQNASGRRGLGTELAFRINRFPEAFTDAWAHAVGARLALQPRGDLSAAEQVMHVTSPSSRALISWEDEQQPPLFTIENGVLCCPHRCPHCTDATVHEEATLQTAAC
jgi:hypothetical protein